MSRVLLTSTQVAKRAGLSVHAFHKIKKLYNPMDFESSILNHRSRPSQKDPSVRKPYWWLNDARFGKNFPDRFGGNTVKWYSDKIDGLFCEIGIGGVL